MLAEGFSKGMGSLKLCKRAFIRGWFALTVAAFLVFYHEMKADHV